MQDRLKSLPQSFGVLTRRDFLKFCAVAAAGMGLPMSAGIRMAEAVAESMKKPPVIWISGQECTGCTESLLRTTHPTVEKLILDLISLDYHETLSTPSGELAEAAKKKSLQDNRGKFILVVEGSIPTKDGGIYCQIGGKPVLQILQEVAPQAMAHVAIGSCAAWGGIPSAGPNPTGAVGAAEALGGRYAFINIPGCPPNPYNFLSTVLYLLTFKKAPELDEQGRPKFAYRRLIHEGCERRAHFDAGRFALEFGDEGHRRGWCLYKLGCKGPETFNNCPSQLFGDVGPRSWPVGTGAPCFGCSEKQVAFTKPIPEMASLKYFTPGGIPLEDVRKGGGELRVTPPVAFAPIETPRGHGVSAGAAALAGAAVGVVVGAAAAMAVKLGREKASQEGGGED
ncbi:MAG: hydrogenase small subunit [Desulfobaccales bacterium]